MNHLAWMRGYLEEIIRKRELSTKWHYNWVRWDIQRNLRKYLWHLQRWLKGGEQ
jgi:hypothetical protein